VAKKAFLLRVDAALWAEVERWAADDLRSANAQVEFLLREALTARRRGSRILAIPPETSPPAGDASDQ
jgi:hypothetical protein